jgi:chemotaxis receptor (MCP) glutamine deamidase CheD/FixJ family two-component response regulator
MADEKRIFLLPGEMAVSRQPVVLATLLGSCVAVCLFNKSIKAGGMNHYMLPTGTNAEMKGKYGDYSTHKLFEMMQRLDPNTNNLVAQIYGGGAVVGHLNTGVGIGEKNIEIALQLLDHYGVKIIKRDVGGTNGRKIFFNTDTGEIQMRPIEKSELTKELEAKKKSISSRKIRVLVVDDSATIRQIISKALAMDDGIEVVGEAGDAFEARSSILELDPDVITLDIIMPKMDGVTFLKKLMMHFPKPVIVVSSIAQKESKQRQRAQMIGAVDVIDKEDLKMYQGIQTATSILASKVKVAAMTAVKKKSEAEIGHI